MENRKNYLYIVGIVTIFLSVSGLLMCFLPAVKAVRLESDSVFDIIVAWVKNFTGSVEENTTNIKVLGLFLAVGILISAFAQGIQFILDANKPLTSKSFAEFKTFEMAREKLWKRCLYCIIVGILPYCVGAGLFFSTKQLLDLNAPVFELGAGAIGGGVVCLLVAITISLGHYFSFKDMIDQLQNKFSKQEIKENNVNPIEKLSKLKDMRQKGIISQEDYDEKKKQILNDM